MSELEHRAHPEIERALEQLRAVIRRTVRAEQLVDQLTKLANDDALNEWIQVQIEQGREFWLAFVEVDRFKSVNDEFGYDDADELLRRIAVQLDNAAKNFFVTSTLAFRAHGDEFFLGGLGQGDGVGGTLDQIRAAVGSLRVKAESRGKPMSCTVSVGWATSGDAQLTGEDLTKRRLRGIVESAVGEAKRERNRVVRFTASMEKVSSREGRADCGACRARFTVSLPIEDGRAGPLRCPNCGGDVDRPVSLQPGR